MRKWKWCIDIFFEEFIMEGIKMIARGMVKEDMGLKIFIFEWKI